MEVDKENALPSAFLSFSPGMGKGSKSSSKRPPRSAQRPMCQRPASASRPRRPARPAPCAAPADATASCHHCIHHHHAPTLLLLTPQRAAAPDRAPLADDGADAAAAEPAELVLKSFAEVPWVNFGVVAMGSSGGAALRITNPGAAAAQVRIERVPVRKGFALTENSALRFGIPSGGSAELSMSWTPGATGNCRETIIMTWEGHNRVQAVLFGNAVTEVSGRAKGKAAPPRGVLEQQRKVDAKAATADQKKRAAKRTPLLPKHTLTLKTQPKAQVSRPELKNRHARVEIETGKKLYYDDASWMQKQESSFAKWLTFTLVRGSADDAPAEGGSHEPSDVSAQLGVLRMRQKCFTLFRGSEIGDSISQLKAAIDAGRFNVKADSSFGFDVRIRDRCIDLVMAYHPAWLRAGLETVFGEEIQRMDASQRDDVLRTFVATRLMHDAETEAMFKADQHNEMRAAMSRFTMFKFLSLALFLDHAKTAGILEADPHLFRVESTVKRSTDMIMDFCKDALSGGGDIIRELRLVEYSVKHQQTALQEVNWDVQDLSTDLRDGVRLCKLVEILTGDSGPIGHVKVPANSTAAKKFNVTMVIDAFKAKGLPLHLCANTADIVSGHRERTLAMVWRVMCHWKIMDMIDGEGLEAEIDRIRDSRRDSIRSNRRRRSSMGADGNVLYMNCDKLRLLLQWCRTVCARYGMRVHNFTSSFSDGVALCLMLHHYHPTVIKMEDISMQTAFQAGFEPAALDEDVDERDVLSLEGGNKWMNMFVPPEAEMDSAKVTAQKNNFALLVKTVKRLGGVPNMLSATDMIDQCPDEKAVLTYVAYISSRVLDIRCQLDAAKTIQRSWRSYFERVHGAERTAAALQIQGAFKSFWLQTGLPNKQRAQAEAASIVQCQAACRGYLVRAAFTHLSVQTIIIQTHFRGMQARIAGKAVRAVVRLQACHRGRTLRQSMTQGTVSAVLIQSAFRRHVAQVRYTIIRCDQLLCAVDVIQSAARVKLARLAAASEATAAEEVSAAVVLQSYFRGSQARNAVRQVSSTVFAVIRFQACFRRHMAKTAYAKTQGGTVALQSMVRGAQARSAVRAMKRLAQQQAAIEANSDAKLEAGAMQDGVVRVQAIARGRSVRKATGKRVRHARRRVRKANANVDPEMVLGKRMHIALQTLVDGADMPDIMAAIKTLDVCTLYMPERCHSVADTSAVRTIFKLIRCCTRSEEHMEVLKSALNALINLARSDKSSRAVFKSKDGVDIIVEQMQMYRDRTSVFLRACKLLKVMCKLDRNRHDMGQMTDVRERLEGIAQICDLKERKAAMHAKNVRTESADGTSELKSAEAISAACKSLLRAIDR